MVSTLYLQVNRTLVQHWVASEIGSAGIKWEGMAIVCTVIRMLSLVSIVLM